MVLYNIRIWKVLTNDDFNGSSKWVVRGYRFRRIVSNQACSLLDTQYLLNVMCFDITNSLYNAKAVAD